MARRRRRKKQQGGIWFPLFVIGILLGGVGGAWLTNRWNSWRAGPSVDAQEMFSEAPRVSLSNSVEESISDSRILAAQQQEQTEQERIPAETRLPDESTVTEPLPAVLFFEQEENQIYLYRNRVDGLDKVLLADFLLDGELFDWAWESVGQQLAVVTTDGMIFVYTFQSGEISTIGRVTGNYVASSLSWSPNGEYLSYVTDQGLWVESLNYVSQRLISSRLYYEQREQARVSKSFSWSPSGEELLYLELGSGTRKRFYSYSMEESSATLRREIGLHTTWQVEWAFESTVYFTGRVYAGGITRLYRMPLSGAGTIEEISEPWSDLASFRLIPNSSDAVVIQPIGGGVARMIRWSISQQREVVLSSSISTPLDFFTDQQQVAWQAREGYQALNFRSREVESLWQNDGVALGIWSERRP